MTPEEAEKEIERLRNALTPFAAVAEFIATDWQDTDCFSFEELQNMPKCGDYRAAAKALEVIA